MLEEQKSLLRVKDYKLEKAMSLAQLKTGEGILDIGCRGGEIILNSFLRGIFFSIFSLYYCIMESLYMFKKGGRVIIHTDNILFQKIVKNIINFINLWIFKRKSFTSYGFLHINYLSK